MANFRAELFNKKASHPKNKPDQIIKTIGLKRGQSIADIGAGGGYFSPSSLFDWSEALRFIEERRPTIICGNI